MVCTGRATDILRNPADSAGKRGEAKCCMDASRNNEICDHINHNGLDNRKANLRLATHRQNLCNRRNTALKAASRYRGVSLHKNTKRWTARIKVYGKTKYLGLFDDEIDAAKAYDAAARRFHGVFASLNFPD